MAWKGYPLAASTTKSNYLVLKQAGRGWIIAVFICQGKKLAKIKSRKYIWSGSLPEADHFELLMPAALAWNAVHHAALTLPAAEVTFFLFLKVDRGKEQAIPFNCLLLQAKLLRLYQRSAILPGKIKQ